MLYDINSYNKRRSFNKGFWDEFTNRDVMQDYNVSDPVLDPAVNVLRTDDEYEVQLVAPGVCREQYTISVHDEILEVKADLPDQSEKDSRCFERQEYRPGRFERSFVVPPNVNQSEIAASCHDGILSIRLPIIRKETSGNKRSIDIN